MIKMIKGELEGHLPRYIALPRKTVDNRVDIAGWSGLYRDTIDGPKILLDHVIIP